MSSADTLARVKQAYTDGGRRLAASSMNRLERSWVTPNTLSVTGVGLSIAGAVAVYFEYVAWPLYLVGAGLFLIGSLVDILDGALARAHDLGTPFGAFLDSTLDRVGEAFMLGAIALVLMREGREWGVALAFAAVAGSFLVSYTRARAEAVGVKGDVGFGSRAERVTVICLGLAFAPLGALPYAMAILTAMAWGTVLQRILHVRKELQGQ